MADDVEMTPVEMTPVAVEPPKVNPLAPAVDPSEAKTLRLAPPLRRPAMGAAPGAGGLKLPPKPGLATAGLKLPLKPGATVGALKHGLKLPPKPGLATGGLKLPSKPGAALAAKPTLRKPGATVAAKPLPKPVVPVPVDAQGVGKLPTVEAKAIPRESIATPASAEAVKPLEALKSVTQKLKGVTQQIPQQAILHKTGIIADAALTEAQKEAAKHKTARISLSDAMGVAPVKNEAAPMKTIRIKRPVNLPGAPVAEATPPEKALTLEPTAPTAAPAAGPKTSVTQRKTLKIRRPGAAVRPAGKFGVKHPTLATGAAKNPVETAAPAENGEVADIPDIPDIPETHAKPMPTLTPASDVPGWATGLSAAVALAAVGVVGTLVYFLYENAQLATFCGGLGWGV